MLSRFHFALPSVLAGLCFALIFTPLHAQTPIIRAPAIFTPTNAQNGMVVTDDTFSTQAGLEVLKNGGNAIDAAVTAGLVMAVTAPQAGNIGGGGFMLIYAAKENKVLALDYRETAPAKAYRDMFLDGEGNPDPQRSRFSHLSAGVPGTLAGFADALEKYGSLSLAQALAPAIALAENGFAMSRRLSDSIQRRAETLAKNPAAKKIFLKADGSFYQTGELFKQTDLAKTLRRLADKGVADFYQGQTARLIEEEMQANGGLIQTADLAAYRPRWREPVHGDYRGYTVYSMSPPSSGGVHLVQMLNILEQDDIGALGHNSAASIHIMRGAMQRAYADRAEYLGDPDFVNVPVKGITDKAYAAKLRQSINPQHATPSAQVRPGTPPAYESPNTTHYAIADKDGNVVSNTYTLNFSFGSGIVVAGAGFLLNNEMDDFSAKPGVPNAYGLIGNRANAVEANKRMLSSMSPTIVLRANKPFIATGSPGGSRIITTVLQVIMNVADHGMNIQEAVNAPRFHHQWLPDILFVEKGISADTLARLRDMGHTVQATSHVMGTASSILIDAQGTFHGAADPRRVGGLAAGF